MRPALGPTLPYHRNTMWTPASFSASFAPFSLVRRGIALALLAFTALCLALVGLLEAHWGVIEPHDRLAYPLLVAWFSGLALRLWRRPAWLPWATGLATAAGALYVMSVAWWVLLGSSTPPGTYVMASLLQWMPLVHLALFATWPLEAAIFGAFMMVASVGAPAWWVQHRGTGGETWSTVIWPLLINGFLAQGMLLWVLVEVAKLRLGLSRLAAGQLPGAAQAHGALAAWWDTRKAELAHAQAQAQAASQAKARFLALMSHELRTPLHAMLSAADLLQPGPDQAQAQAQNAAAYPASQALLLRTIRSSGQHLQGLIEQLLDVARIGSGQQVLEPRAFDAHALAGELLSRLVPSAELKGLSLQWALPPAGAKPERWGDAHRVQQILHNLITHAIRCAPQGQVVVEGPWPRHPQDAILGTMAWPATAGDGLDWLHWRISAPSAPTGATSPEAQDDDALELTLSHELVEHMNGLLRWSHQREGGVVADLFLPLPTAASASPATSHAGTKALEASAVVDQAPTPQATLHGVHVLLVEDDVLNQTLARAMLEAAGAQVSVTENGSEALQALRNLPVQLVLMDWRMPVMDGLEATRRLRAGEAGERAARLPIVALTAHAFSEDAQACLQAGMNLVLTKPVVQAELVAAIARLLACGSPAASGAAAR